MIASRFTNNKSLPVDKAVDHISFYTIPKGTQAIIRIEGEPTMLSVINPSDWRKPILIANDDGFDEVTDLEKEDVDGLQDDNG